MSIKEPICYSCTFLAKLSFPYGVGIPTKDGYKNILHLLMLRESPILHDSLFWSCQNYQKISETTTTSYPKHRNRQRGSQQF